MLLSSDSGTKQYQPPHICFICFRQSALEVFLLVSCSERIAQNKTQQPGIKTNDFITHKEYVTAVSTHCVKIKI